jgi:hypothetical protein
VVSNTEESTLPNQPDNSAKYTVRARQVAGETAHVTCSSSSENVGDLVGKEHEFVWGGRRRANYRGASGTWQGGGFWAFGRCLAIREMAEKRLFLRRWRGDGTASGTVQDRENSAEVSSSARFGTARSGESKFFFLFLVFCAFFFFGLGLAVITIMVTVFWRVKEGSALRRGRWFMSVGLSDAHFETVRPKARCSW